MTNKLRAEAKAKARRVSTEIPWCPQCGPYPSSDEEGCCYTCGATLGMIPNFVELLDRLDKMEISESLHQRGHEILDGFLGKESNTHIVDKVLLLGWDRNNLRKQCKKLELENERHLADLKRVVESHSQNSQSALDIIKERDRLKELLVSTEEQCERYRNDYLDLKEELERLQAKEDRPGHVKLGSIEYHNAVEEVTNSSPGLLGVCEHERACHCCKKLQPHQYKFFIGRLEILCACGHLTVFTHQPIFKVDSNSPRKEE